MSRTQTINDETTRSGRERNRRGFRADIEALRAISVVAVLLYHLWPNRFTGGYVGVDVFFAISGFLITSHLHRELVTTGRISVGHFWARRARRLLPASILVLACTVIGVVAVVPGRLWSAFLTEISAATLYVENWWLAAQSVDYLGAAAAPSPVQHFWTLSVEEQFYVVFPLLIIAGLAVGRRLRWDRVTTLRAAIAIATAASFAYSVWLTPLTDSAYFSTFTRAWEFGLGASIALLPSKSRGFGALAIVGVAGILGSVFFFSNTTAIPGYSALLPVGGAVAVMWSANPNLLDRLGNLAPVGFFGRISYSLYLWHWPLIVLIPYSTGLPLAAPEKIAIAIAAITLAWVSTQFWEEPIRFSQRITGLRRPRTVAKWTAIAMAIVIAFSGALTVIQTDWQTDAKVRSDAVAAEAMSSGCFGAASAVDAKCGALPAIDAFVPALGAADDDNRPECWAGRGVADFRMCSLGPASGYSRHLLVIGDSHSNTLLGVYEKIAIDRGWRLDVAGHAGCYLTTARLNAPDQSSRLACDTWRNTALDVIRSSPDIDALIVTRSSSATAAFPEGGESSEDAQIKGMVTAWETRPDIPIVVIRDNPAMPSTLYECLEKVGPRAATRCNVDRDVALLPDLQVNAAARVQNAHVVDFSPIYCDAVVCRPVIGNAVVYRPDGNHLTATFAHTLTPYLLAELERILR